MKLQLNPAKVYFKGLEKIMLLGPKFVGSIGGMMLKEGAL